MDKEQTQTEISLIDIWNKLLKYKFIIIIITGIITIGGFLTIFFYNKANEVIVNQFSYDFQGVDNHRYPDGNIFDFVDLSNANFLELVKSKNPKFKDVDIEKLITNDKMNLAVIITPDIKRENEFKTHYKIEMPIKAFGNKNIAELFIREFHNTFLEIVIEKNKSLDILNYFDYDNYDDFQKNLTYNDILELINLQNRIITSSSSKFLSTYNHVNTIIDGVNYNLNNMMQRYLLWFNKNVNTNQLAAEILENGYIRNYDETLKITKARLNEIERQLTINNKLIDDLKQMAIDLGLPGNSESDVFYFQIERLLVENSILDFERDDLNKLILESEDNFNEEFELEIKSIIENINSFTKTYNLVTNSFLNNITRYVRVHTRDFKIEAPFKLITMTAVFGVIGLVITSAVVLSFKEKEEI